MIPKHINTIALFKEAEEKKSDFFDIAGDTIITCRSVYFEKEYYSYSKSRDFNAHNFKCLINKNNLSIDKKINYICKKC